MASPRTVDLALLLALGLIWGHSYLFITLGLGHFSPLLFAALRFDLTALALFLFAFGTRRRSLLPRDGASWGAIVAAALLNTATYHALLFWGQDRTTPAVAAVIVGLNPILATVATRFLLPTERATGRDWLGLAIGFAGVSMLALLRGGDAFDVQGIGEFAIFAGILAWAVGAVLVKRTDHTMDLVPFVAWHSLLGGLVLHGASLLLEEPRWSFETEALASLGYLALAASSVGLLIFYRLLRNIGVMRANTVSYLSAVVAAVAAWLFLDLELETRLVVAFVLIAAGFLLVTRQRAPDPAQ